MPYFFAPNSVFQIRRSRYDDLERRFLLSKSQAVPVDLQMRFLANLRFYLKLGENAKGLLKESEQKPNECQFPRHANGGAVGVILCFYWMPLVWIGEPSVHR